MFYTLVESRPRRQRRAGGSMISIAVHVAAVAALVVATAQAGVRVAEPTPSERVYFPPVVRQVVPPSPASEPAARCISCTPSAVADVPAMPLVPPVDIPNAIPDVGVATGLTDRLLNDVRVSRGSGGTPDGVVGGRGAASDEPFFEWSVERPAMLAPGARSPAYPEALRAAGISGAVLVEFVVDTSGRVERGSLKLVSADHRAFFTAVERSLPEMRFLPAEAGGRRVRQHVRLPFRFDLDRE